MSNTYAHTVTRPLDLEQHIWDNISQQKIVLKHHLEYSWMLSNSSGVGHSQSSGPWGKSNPLLTTSIHRRNCWMFQQGKTYNTRCKRGNDWGLLLGNHVNLEGGMRKSARRNKGASLTTVTFDPTRCQTLFCCHAESFSCLGWMWLESEKNATGSTGGSIMFHLNIASELQESPSAALPGFSKLDRTWEFSTQVKPTTKPYKTHDCC